MSMANQDSKDKLDKGAVDPREQAEAGVEEETYGWAFHRGPLIAAAVVTVIFYAIVFLVAPKLREEHRKMTLAPIDEVRQEVPSAVPAKPEVDAASE